MVPLSEYDDFLKSEQCDAPQFTATYDYNEIPLAWATRSSAHWVKDRDGTTDHVVKAFQVLQEMVRKVSQFGRSDDVTL